jgi:hypothetical protein
MKVNGYIHCYMNCRLTEYLIQNMLSWVIVNGFEHSSLYVRQDLHRRHTTCSVTSVQMKQQCNRPKSTPVTQVCNLCIMGLSDEDVMVLTMAIANNYGARRRRKVEHWMHPYIAEKVLTYGTFTASRDYLSILVNLKKCVVRVRNHSVNHVNMLDCLY